MSVSAYINGLGVLGPGLSNWADTAAILSGGRAYHLAPTQLPMPTILPAAERRRTGRGRHNDDSQVCGDHGIWVLAAESRTDRSLGSDVVQNGLGKRNQRRAL